MNTPCEVGRVHEANVPPAGLIHIEIDQSKNWCSVYLQGLVETTKLSSLPPLPLSGSATHSGCGKLIQPPRQIYFAVLLSFSHDAGCTSLGEGRVSTHGQRAAAPTGFRAAGHWGQHTFGHMRGIRGCGVISKGWPSPTDLAKFQASGA